MPVIRLLNIALSHATAALLAASLVASCVPSSDSSSITTRSPTVAADVSVERVVLQAYRSIGDRHLNEPDFRKMAQEAGRDPASLPVTIGGAPDDPDALKRFRDLGAARAVVTLMSETRDQLLPTLDRWAGHIRQLRG